MKYKVLVTAKILGELSEEPVRRLRQAGCEVGFTDLRRPIGPGLLATIIKGYDAVIVGNDVVDKAAIDAGDKLKVVVMHGVGLDAIDVEYARSKGITVRNLPGVNADTVAEFSLGLMLSLARRIHESAVCVEEGHWRRFTGTDLSGKALGIVGLGAIGKALAVRARALGMDVVAFNRSKDQVFSEANSVAYVELDELLGRSDFVSLHTPITPETRNILSRKRLALMKKGSFLVNTARGGLVDETALLDALRSGHLAGAALDVFEKEPVLGDSPFIGLPNVILTPHIASQSSECMLRSSLKAVEETIKALNG